MKAKEMEGQIQKTITNQANEPTDTRLIPKGISYWPVKSLKFEYAKHCLEVVLLHSNEANEYYREIIRCWDKPGCQAILEAAKPYLPDILNNLNDLEKYIQFVQIDVPFDRTPLLAFCQEFQQLKKHLDIQYLESQVRELLLVGFNRKVDRDNKVWKVKPSNFPILLVVILSLFDFFKIRPQDFFQAKIKVNDKIHNVNDVPAIPDTTRERRAIKSHVGKTFKDAGFVQHYTDKLFMGAVQWYKCRVNPGTIEAYLDEVSIISDPPPERSNVETALAPYDEAVGYPRKWRK